MEKLHHGDLTCDVEQGENNGEFTGVLRYRTFEVGRLSELENGRLRARFETICAMIDDGAMVRHGIVMLGYHNGDFKGDVILVDGEVIGNWESDDEEWCHFTARDASKTTCSAPSPWMLHDVIADWIEAGNVSKEA